MEKISLVEKFKINTFYIKPKNQNYMKKTAVLLAFLSLNFCSFSQPKNYGKVTDSLKFVYFEIQKYTRYHEIAFAIACLESGNLTSRLAREQNNIFGMKYPEKRATAATYKANGYAGYLSKRMAVLDYGMYEIDAAINYGVNNENDFWIYVCDNYKADTIHPEDYADLLIKQILYNRKKYNYVEPSSELIFKE